MPPRRRRRARSCRSGPRCSRRRSAALVLDARLPGARLVADGLRRRRAGAGRARRAARLGRRCWSGFAFGASFFLVNLVVHRALPRRRCRGSPSSMLEARPHGGRSDPDHAGLSLDAARAARAAGRSSSLLPLLVAGLWTLARAVRGLMAVRRASRGGGSASRSPSSPLAHLASWVGVAGLTFLMVAVLRGRDRVACASRRFRDVRTALPALGRRAAARRRARSSRRRRPARCASAACRATARRATSTSATPQRRAATPSSRRPPRCSARTWTCCCGRRAASTPIRRANASTAAVAGRAARADRRAADRERGRPRAATSTSTRRCCGSAGEGAVQTARQAASGAVRRVRARSLVLRAARAGPHRPHPARVHAGHRAAVLRPRRRRRRPGDLLRRDLRRRHLGRRARTARRSTCSRPTTPTSAAPTRTSSSSPSRGCARSRPGARW